MLRKNEIKFLKGTFKVEMGKGNVCIYCDEETAKMIARNTSLVHIGTIGNKSLFN